jgi:hypothetical protein
MAVEMFRGPDHIAIVVGTGKLPLQQTVGTRIGVLIYYQQHKFSLA